MARARYDDGTEELVSSSHASRHAALSDRALIDAMRARDGEAIEEFMRRFQHLVFVQAKRLRIPGPERRQWVGDLLVEVASSLARRRRDVPRAIPPYLVTAAKRKAFADRRQQALRDRLTNANATEIGGVGECALPGTCSEASIRATHGPGWEPSTLPQGLVHLVERLDARMSHDERELLSWIAHRVPYSTIAQWLGITRAAAIKRGTRLRARLVDVVLEIGVSLEGEERAQLLRFLRRTGGFDAAALSSLDGAAPVSHHTLRGAGGSITPAGSAVRTEQRQVAENRTGYPLDAEGHERGGHGTE
jgi:hypothetical protein